MSVCVYERNTPGAQLELGGLTSDIIVQPAKTTRISYSVIPVCRTAQTPHTHTPGTVHNMPRPCYNVTCFTRVKSHVIIAQLAQVDEHHTVVGCPTTTVMHTIKNTALLCIINTRDDRRLRGSGSCFARLESQNTCFFCPIQNFRSLNRRGHGVRIFPASGNFS